MLTLGGRALELRNFDASSEPEHLLLSDGVALPEALKAKRAFLIKSAATTPLGYDTYVAVKGQTATLQSISASSRVVILPDEFSYLADGDILRLSPRSSAIRTLYRKRSRQNFILTTEQCNNYCLMCSQPPKLADDSWLIDDILRLIPLIDRATPEITLTGGEPTLLGDGFLEIVSACKSWLPETSIHVLSNGRTFSNRDFARRLAAIDHPDLMVGIPLYSDLSDLHDYVVQADGAYDETIRGILNLKQQKQRVEIRVVIHKQTYARMPDLAEFIARNLRFVDQVVFMGLEITGFTRANLEQLWIDPIEYQNELCAAIRHLTLHKVRTAIYNHQLCLLPRELWPYARKSISDWKNEYMPECEGCSVMSECGGFFSSAKLRYSNHITPILQDALLLKA